MKKLMKDPLIILTLGGLGFAITNLLEKSYVKSILAPIFLFIEIVGVAFMIKDCIKEKKVKQEEKTTDSTYKNHSNEDIGK